MTDPNFPANRFPQACPCCGFDTLEERFQYEICPICWWEDGPEDNHNANSHSPQNHLSLTRARINYLEHGIFNPARVDLRTQQAEVDGYSQSRRFVLDADQSHTATTISETTTAWSAKIASLDENRSKSYFQVSDRVVYRRRDVDSNTKVGAIERVEWHEPYCVWRYRLSDETEKTLEKWFFAHQLEHLVLRPD